MNLPALAGSGSVGKYLKERIIRMKKQGWHFGIKNKEIGKKFMEETSLKKNKRCFLIFSLIEIICGCLILGIQLLEQEDIMFGVVVFCITLFTGLICVFCYMVMKKRIRQCETGKFYVITCVCEHIEEKTIKNSYGERLTNYTLMVNIEGEHIRIKCWNKCIHREIKKGEEVSLATFSINYKRQLALVLDKVYEEYR